MMTMKMVIFILLTILIVSCSEEQDKVKTNNDKQISESSQNSNSKVLNFETNVEQKNENDATNPKEQETYKTISSKELAEVLPKTIAGTTPNAYKYGNILEKNINITVASREYLYPDNAYVKFSITDYFISGNIPVLEKRGFDEDLSLSSDKKFRRFMRPNAKGYVIEDEFLKESQLFLLYKNRFLIRVEMRNHEQNNFIIEDYLKFINFKKLDKLIKKYK